MFVPLTIIKLETYFNFSDSLIDDNAIPNRKFKRTPYIKNGNIFGGAIVYKKASYMLKNTCAFDSVLVGIVTAYTDYSSFRWSDNMDSEFLRLAKSVSIKNRMDRKLYVTRLNLLRQNFESKIDEYGLINIDTKCNVYKIINKYLNTMPSSKQYSICSNKCSVTSDLSSSTIIFSTDDISSDKTFKQIENWLKNYVAVKTYPCHNLNCTTGRIKTQRVLQNTFFIEADNISFGNNHKRPNLNDFPLTINVQDNQLVIILY